MDLALYQWNSLNINDGSPFYSDFPKGQKANLAANPVTVNRADDFPFLSTRVLTPHSLVIGVRIAPGQNINTNRENVKKYFNIMDGTRHNLIAKDRSDSDRQYYVTGFVTRVAPQNDDENAFTISFALEYPYWKVVTTLTSTWNITASAQTAAVTNVGNISVPPSFAITPTTAASSGLSYRRWVPIYNNLDTTYTDVLDITGGGLDTATLTPAKMQTSGNDFRVWMDGVEVDRWLDAMDSAATKCWVNVSLSPKKEGTHAATIANTGAVAAITFSQTRANLAFLQAAKRAGNRILLIGSEAFSYTAANVDIFNYQITSPSRTQKGTSAATHAAAGTVRLIEHDTWILYGDSSLGAPDTDDDNKPMFSLSSTNAVRTYSNYFDATASRPGAWKGGVLSTKSGLSYTFTGNENTFANPSTELGMAAIGSASIYTAQGETATIAWQYSHPAGASSVIYSGKKYTTDTNSWPAIVALQYLQEDAAWFTQQNEAVPTAALTWQTFGPHTEALTDSPTTIRFAIDGAISPTAEEMAMAQFDTVSVSLSTASLPTISVGAEQSMYDLDFTLANLITGESIKCRMPCAVGQTLTVDCENKQATLSDGGRAVVTFSSDRAAWLDLASGANTLRFTDAGTNGVQIITSHRDRNL